ncbi:hypothetical protein [Mycobacterium sp. HUMS_1102779]|uniref:hypothetical protein n=1 Tax=Mycobacterium sp. HUMS_1102779 TaxID=3383487 RepID=UPI00389AE1B6
MGKLGEQIPEAAPDAAAITRPSPTRLLTERFSNRNGFAIGAADRLQVADLSTGQRLGRQKVFVSAIPAKPGCLSTG